jgi:hypothetical protein
MYQERRWVQAEILIDRVVKGGKEYGDGCMETGGYEALAAVGIS